jgi:hypothetical protein
MNRRRCIRRSLLGAVAIAVLIPIRECVSPHDWVKLRMMEVPDDLDRIVVLRGEGVEPYPLNVYRAKLFADTEVPMGGEWSWNSPPGERRGDVQWVSGDWYGILARRETGEWVTWRLAPEHVQGPSSLRYLLGGGTATIRASGSEAAAPAPASLLKRIWGVNEVFPHERRDEARRERVDG